MLHALGYLGETTYMVYNNACETINDYLTYYYIDNAHDAWKMTAKKFTHLILHVTPEKFYAQY